MRIFCHELDTHFEFSGESDGEETFGSTSRFGSDEYEDDGTLHQNSLVFCQKSPVFFQKRLVFTQKSPIFYQTRVYIAFRQRRVRG